MAHEEFQDQLDRLCESANDSARSFRTSYTFYLVISLYILAIVAATDHELLFRNGTVDLPIINIGVSVKQFFIFAPLILAILHFNLLIQGLFLSDKIFHYVAELDKHSFSRNKRTVALSHIFPVPLALKIANRGQQRSTRILLNTMVLLSITLLSPAILIYGQIKFLPYQDVIITWLHPVLVLADIALLWLLWPRIAAPNKKWCEWLSGPRQASTVIRNRWRSSISNPLHLVSVGLMLGVTFIAVPFIFIIADFPGGTVSMLLPKLEPIRNHPLLERKYNLSGHVIVSKEPSSEVLSAYYRASCKSDIYGSISCDESTIEIGSSSWCKHAKPIQLKNRNMRSADLSNAILCGAGLEDANLYDANISGANLRGAKLRDADLRGADLSEANLRDARLRDADLRGADLSEANLRDARLRDADLRGADLSEANLRDARLRDADLRGARLLRTDLNGARLQSADLRNIQFRERCGFLLLSSCFYPPNLRDTDLSMSNFNGVYLSKTSLSGANLSRAEFLGADLSEAKLHGVDLTGALLDGADLSGAILSAANLSWASLRGANLSGTKFHGADLSNTDLSGANLKGSQLIGVQLIETKLDLADLRNIDFVNQPDMNIVRIIQDINDSSIKEKALKRIDDAEMKNTSIRKLSLNDTILCKTEYIYTEMTRSETELLGQASYIVDCETETEAENYFKELVTYLSDLACSDKSGYITKGIANRALSDEEFGSELARSLLNRCSEVVVKILSEDDRDRLKTISEEMETLVQ